MMPPEKIFGLVRAQHGGRRAIQIVLPQRLVELQQLGLPVAPLRDVVLADLGVVLEQSGSRLLSRLGPDRPEAQRQHELAVAGREIDLAREGNVAVFRARVFPLHLEMLRQILPAIGRADESHRHFLPRRRRRQAPEWRRRARRKTWGSPCSRRSIPCCHIRNWPGAARATAYR